jgi:hypothetical protein
LSDAAVAFARSMRLHLRVDWPGRRPVYRCRIMGTVRHRQPVVLGQENHMKRSIGLIVLGIIAVVAVAYLVIAAVIR